MKTSRISNEHPLIFSVLWTVCTSRRFSRCCWLDKKMRRHHMKDVLCTQGWVLKESIIERRSMTSRHHGRTICGWQQNQRQRRQDGSRMAKKVECFYFIKQQICTCITLFCTFLCRRCTPASDMKLPNFTLLLYGVGEHNTKVVFFSLLNLDTVLSDSARGHFANICQIKWNWISSMKFEQCEFTL